MPGAFVTEDIASMLDVEEFADLAAIAGFGDDIPGLFDDEYLAVQVFGVDVEGHTPVFMCETSRVSGIAQGVSVVIGARTFEVAEPRPDGTGVTALRLRELT